MAVDNTLATKGKYICLEHNVEHRFSLNTTLEESLPEILSLEVHRVHC